MAFSGFFLFFDSSFDYITKYSFYIRVHPNNQESKFRKLLPEELEKSHNPIPGARGNRRKKQGGYAARVFDSNVVFIARSNIRYIYVSLWAQV
ncbi:hypothetical protein GQ457_01G020610 [Hibiscus cannabinus]